METGTEKSAADRWRARSSGPSCSGCARWSLARLRGPEWRSNLSALPGTQVYADRVRVCAESWPTGYVAHHYTRHLGDLCGGQIIRDKAERTWGFEKKGDEELSNPAAFKRGYRELLDAVDADDLEKQRIVAECKRAFALNTGVFRALGEEFPLSA